MKSWKPEFEIGGAWYGNGIRFATYEEAFENAKDKFSRWTVPTGYRAVEAEEEPNYSFEGGKMTAKEGA